MTDDVVLPDPRRVKRAVRWGVIRTAGGAVGWVFSGLVFLILVGFVFDATFDHRNRFQKVVGSAFIASQPDYRWGISTPTTAAPFFYGNTMPISGRLRGVDDEWSPITELSLYQSALGHLGDITPWPQGPVTNALRRGRPEKADTLALLADLPVHSRAIAVVELRTPYAWDGGRRPILPDKLPAIGDLMWLEPPYREVTFDDRYMRNPLTWTVHGTLPTTFREWTESLRDSDAGNLRPFGLPSIKQLRDIGRSPAVYGYLTRAVDIADLAKIAQRTDVVSVRLVDVRLPVDVTPAYLSAL